MGEILGSIIGILIILAVGLVIGLIARFLLPGPDPAGIGLTALIGVAGSFIGGLLGQVMGVQAFGGLILAIFGAVFLVWLLRVFRTKRIG